MTQTYELGDKPICPLENTLYENYCMIEGGNLRARGCGITCEYRDKCEETKIMFDNMKNKEMKK